MTVNCPVCGSGFIIITYVYDKNEFQDPDKKYPDCNRFKCMTCGEIFK